MTQSRQRAFHEACVGFFRGLEKPGLDAWASFQLASKKHLPDAVFVESTPCPEIPKPAGPLASVVSELFKAPFFMGQVDFKGSVQHVVPRTSSFRKRMLGFY